MSHCDENAFPDKAAFAVVCTRIGTVVLLDMTKGDVIARCSCEGEIFSSPVVAKNKIIVGCRDNNLYCFDVKQSLTEAAGNCDFVT